MPRVARVAPPGLVYHVMNRAVGKAALFRTRADHLAFQRVMLEAFDRVPLRILSYCVMRNHWHFAVWPRQQGELTAYFRWLANTHAVRWRVAHRTAGEGHLYQGRFRSFPTQQDGHALEVCRYVERNALSAGLVTRAEDWRWGSLWAHERGDQEEDDDVHALRAMLLPQEDWPVRPPPGWVRWVNEPLTPRELERLGVSERRGRPYGGDAWIARTVTRLGLSHTVRPEGRPPKKRSAGGKTRGG